MFALTNNMVSRLLGAFMTRKGSRKKLMLGLGAAALAGALIYGIFRFAAWISAYESTDDATLFEDGLNVSSDVMGRVVSLKGEEGDQVVEGEELVKLDESGIDAQVSQAEVSVDYAERSVNLAKIKEEEARSDFERAEAQFQRKIIPLEQYEHQRQALDASKAELDISTAQWKLAIAQLQTLRTNVPRASIVSPIPGIIAKRWVSPGEVVQPAQPIFTLYDLGALKVKAFFKETQIRRIHVGDIAKINIDACPGIDLSGTVETIGIATASQFSLLPADNASGNYTKVVQRIPVTIALSKSPPKYDISRQRLGPGLSSEVQITIKR